MAGFCTQVAPRMAFGAKVPGGASNGPPKSRYCLRMPWGHIERRVSQRLPGNKSPIVLRVSPLTQDTSTGDKETVAKSALASQVLGQRACFARHALPRCGANDFLSPPEVAAVPQALRGK